VGTFLNGQNGEKTPPTSSFGLTLNVSDGLRFVSVI